jgi:hypothetical protein
MTTETQLRLTCVLSSVLLGFMVLFATAMPALVRSHAAERSSQWPKVRAAYYKTHPDCAACGAVGTSRRQLDVHHVVPVHVDASKELDEHNLITLCPRCHLYLGHLGSFQDGWNIHVREDAALYRSRIKYRDTGGVAKKTE